MLTSLRRKLFLWWNGYPQNIKTEEDAGYPTRQLQWCAWLEPNKSGDILGFGSTEREAMDDLMMELEIYNDNDENI